MNTAEFYTVINVPGFSPFDHAVDNRSFICSEFVYCADRAGRVKHSYSGRGFIAPSDILGSNAVSILFGLA